MVVERLSLGDGFEVGDMVWAKMRSQSWWPGYVYSEEFATPLVRQSRRGREGVLLVAFFGGSSFGWFEPTELIGFESNYAEMCRQTSSRAFVKAVKDAVVEVNRRIGLGLSCMCRNKLTSGAVDSVSAIGKARDGFQPRLALDFLRELALEPTGGEGIDDIDFVKNKATVLSYRKAVFMDLDERYDLASVQEPAPQNTSSKAPLNGMAVLADSLGKVKNTLNLEDHARKDEYLFKRRDNSKELKKEKEEVVNGPEEARIPKRPVGELGLGKIITTENTKKQKKEGTFLADSNSAKKTVQPEGTQRIDDNYETDLSRVLGDLHSLAVDPFNIVNRGPRKKGKKAFLRFRSLVFQKSKNFSLPLVDGEPNASESSEDNVEAAPVKPLSGHKRVSSECRDEVNVSIKKKVGDIRKLTDEKNLVNKIDEDPTRNVEQPIATALKKSGPGPAILILKFPQGGYLPSFNELKTRFARYGPMDHSATQILRNTFSCQVVFRHSAHAQAAYKFVVGSTNLFGNTDVKCSLKNFGGMEAAESEPLVKAPKGHYQPALEDRPSLAPAVSGVLKKSGDEKAAGKGAREVFVDSLGKVINTAKPTDHAVQDGDLFKPRDESKMVISLLEKLSANKTGQPDCPERSDHNNETGPLWLLDVLHSLAVDPCNTVNRGSLTKGRRALLRFRSCAFQKGQNFSLSLAGGEPNASKSSEDSVEVPPVNPANGFKRGLSDRQQEMAAAKKKRVGDIKNLIKEKKVTKMIDEPPARNVKQPVATIPKKPGPELTKKTDQQAPGPTMLTIKFPKGGSLPSYNELKARFACYGPMDHSATHIFWNTFTCQVVFRHKAHAQAAYRFVVDSTSVFGNTGVKCSLKEVEAVRSTKPEPAVEVPKEIHLPDMNSRPLSLVPATSDVLPKSIMKKSGGEESAGNNGRGRVKFMLGGEESQLSGATSITSNSKTDVSGKNFEKVLFPSVLTSPTGTRPSSPPSLPPLPTRSKQTASSRVLNGPLNDPLTTPNIDITEQMLSLLMRCNDVVTNVISILGYSPYHPL